MTPNSARKWAKEIKALQEGKTIQSRVTDPHTGYWFTTEDPTFREGYEYRVAPEVPEEMWVNIYPSGVKGVAHLSKESAAVAARPDLVATVHFKRVQ